MTNPAIEIENVWFAYQPDVSVLRGLNLSARSGEILGLLGANGAGKTTTFRLLASLLRPDSGGITVAGVDVIVDAREAKRRCAYVPDEPLLYPRLSALENLNMFAVLWGVPGEVARARSTALLRQVGLWDVRDQWAETYSRGMRQRLALCTALLHEPAVLLMDEPFSGLDIEAGIWARGMLRDFTENGGCVVFTSHTPELVEAVADRVAVLHEGKVAYDAPRSDVIGSGGMTAVFQRVHNRPAAAEVGL